MTTITKLCEDFGYDTSKMTREQKETIKLLTHWTEAKIKQRTKSLETTIKNQQKEIKALKKLVGNYKKPSPGDSDFKYTKKGKIFITEYKDVVLVTGQTYDVRPVIKSYTDGFSPKWDKELGGWVMSTETDVDDLVKELEPLVVNIQVASSDKILFTDKEK